MTGILRSPLPRCDHPERGHSRVCPDCYWKHRNEQIEEAATRNTCNHQKPPGALLCGQCSVDEAFAAAVEKVRSNEEASRKAHAERIASEFHAAYERLAPSHGYDTREASAKPWADVPEANKNLMVATVLDLLNRGVIR